MLRTLRFPAVFAVAALSLFAATGCGDDVPSGAVAKVGDESIPRSEFNHWLTAAARQQAQGQPGQKADTVVVPDPPTFARCVEAKQKQKQPQGAQPQGAAQLKTQCKQEYDGLKEQTMQFLISARWLKQEAKKRDVKATPAEVQKTFQEQKKQAFPKEKDYQEFLKTSGRTEKDLLFQVELSVLTNALQAKVVQGEGDPSKDDIEKYYNENKKRFSTPESRDLLVVLTKKEDKAKKALGELKANKPWKTVVKKYSEDTASKSQGGKLPGVTKGTQEKGFDDAIFKATKGDVQGPIKTQFGFYVFEVTKVTPATQQTLQQATETIKNLLKSQAQQKALNDFVKNFQKRYREQTKCADDFKTTQCDNGPKPPDEQQQHQQSGPQGGPPTRQGGAQPGAPTTVPPGGVPPGTPGAPQGGAPQQGAPQQGAPPQGGAPQGAPPQGAPPQSEPPPGG
jgi:foldase protein PrsA